VEALRGWAQLVGGHEILEGFLKRCPGYPAAPLVVAAQYDNFAHAVQWALAHPGAMDDSDVPF
jgi:hypothetical protein